MKNLINYNMKFLYCIILSCFGQWIGKLSLDNDKYYNIKRYDAQKESNIKRGFLCSRKTCLFEAILLYENLDKNRLQMIQIYIILLQ